jgi:YgiT-type zinc finger domain-containing protein
MIPASTGNERPWRLQMTRSATVEWGQCPCGGHYEHRLIEVKMTVDGARVTLTDVPQGACPNCGSRVYKAEMLARIEGVMKNETLDRPLSWRAT